MEGARLVSNKGLENEKHFELPIDGFFLGIGHKPNSDIFKKWVKLDDNGYIMTEGKSASTGHAGVFAAGDVADPNYRQAITAAASGCRAALDAEKYLKTL